MTIDRSGSADGASLEGRVRSLERRLRVGYYAMAALGALLAFALFRQPRETGADRGASDSARQAGDRIDEGEPKLGGLEGSSLTLRTADGRVWLTARPLETGGELYLRSTDSMYALGPPPGIQLRAERDSKYVVFSNGGSFPLVQVGVYEDGPAIQLFDPDARPLAGMTRHPDGHGFIWLSSRSDEKQPVWYAPPGARIK